MKSDRLYCKNKHKFVPENIYIRPDGRRECRICKRQYNHKWEKENRGGLQEARRAYLRSYRLQHQYGLSLERFQTILKDQDFSCAICKEFLEKPCVDHDHQTGKVRGLLCDFCNQGLGRFKDSYERVSSAAEYLANFITVKQ